MRPGESIELEIAALGAQGDGIGFHDSQAVYVPDALPGERVRARLLKRRGQGWAAAAEALLARAAERIQPRCRHFGDCGGCSVQHLANAAYAGWKRELVVQALRRKGFADPPVLAPILSPPGSRRRVHLAAQRRGREMRLGFHGRRSHALVDVGECPVATPAIEALLAPLRALLGRILPGRAAMAAQVTDTDSGLDLWLQGGGTADLSLRSQLAGFAEERDLARLSWGPERAPETIAERRPPQIGLEGIALHLPPGAFLQATAAGEAALRGFALRHLPDGGRVADLFCGCGTFALPMARTARVLAVDADPSLLGALTRAARQAPGLRAPNVEQRDLFRRPLLPAALKGLDLVLFDPPRAGAEAQAAALAQSRVPQVIAVSCNPASFARDARILADGGYRLGHVQPVDQFLWSGHVELAAHFTRA